MIDGREAIGVLHSVKAIKEYGRNIGGCWIKEGGESRKGREKIQINFAHQ